VNPMSPPPPPPPEPGDYYAPVQYGPPPWSAAAITAFVLSLLGCAGVPVPLALIFAVIGIIKTASGRLRGLGLAIAAIPISLFSGILTILMFAFVVLGLAIATVTTQLPDTLMSATADTAGAARIIYHLGTADFQQKVSETELRSWLDGVMEQNGKLTRVSDKPDTRPVSDGKSVELHLTAHFVNAGEVPMVVTFVRESFWKYRIGDIEIDGKSPRV
jgi:hypothetical protein